MLQINKNGRFLKWFVAEIVIFNILHLSAEIPGNITNNKINTSVDQVLMTQFPRNDDLKVILLWTPPSTEPFHKFSLTGLETFTTRKCEYQCYVTDDVAYLDHITKFDAVLFNAFDLQEHMSHSVKYLSRGMYQVYVLVSTAPANTNPITYHFNNVFNWTWTYKLNSDVVWGKIVIKDSKGQVIGPKTNMNWISLKNMKPVEDVRTRSILLKKSKAVAWLVSNCGAYQLYADYVDHLHRELESYGLQVDVYGKCANLDCPDIEKLSSCFELIQRDYYFYLSFENYIAEDYVTEKLLVALKNFAVPVVIGGANYTRFMPRGMYVDAFGVDPPQLANKLIKIMENTDIYIDMFRWRNHYSYYATTESPSTDPICKFCAFLSADEFLMKSYPNIVLWFNGRHYIPGHSTPERKPKLQIANMKNMEFILNSKVCDRVRNMKFVTIISSGTDRISKRNAIRETWGQTQYMKIVFILGLPENEGLANNIKEEHKQYEDIVQGNFLDTYRNLTYKHLMGLAWVYEYCPQAKFVLKTDDDVFIHLRVLHDLLDNGLEDDVDLISCKVWHAMHPIRDKMARHYVSEKDFPDYVYPPYCSGSVIIYSSKVTSLLVRVAKTTPYISVDDMYVTGILRVKLNLSLTDLNEVYLAPENKHWVIDKRLNMTEKFLFGPIELDEAQVREMWKATEEYWMENDYEKVYYSS